MSSDRFFLPAPAPCTRRLLPRGGLRGVGVWRLVCCVQRLRVTEVVTVRTPAQVSRILFFQCVIVWRLAAPALLAKRTHFVNVPRAASHGVGALPRNLEPSHFVWSVIVPNSGHVTIAFRLRTENNIALSDVRPTAIRMQTIHP